MRRGPGGAGDDGRAPMGLTALFLAAFLAATPVPMQSEVVFLALQAAGWPLVWLVCVASAGNVLGSCVTYGFGRWARGLSQTGAGRRWLGLTPEGLARAQDWFSRWGIWALLLCWAPGGDLIVALAGVMRVRPAVFLALVTLAKTGRYVALGLAAAGLFGWQG